MRPLTSFNMLSFHCHRYQGCDMSIKDLDELLTLLAEKKRKMEQEEAETNMQILLGFLYFLRKQKLEELNEVSFTSLVTFCFFLIKNYAHKSQTTLCVLIKKNKKKSF